MWREGDQYTGIHGNNGLSVPHLRDSAEDGIVNNDTFGNHFIEQLCHIFHAK